MELYQPLFASTSCWMQSQGKERETCCCEANSSREKSKGAIAENSRKHKHWWDEYPDVKLVISITYNICIIHRCKMHLVWKQSCYTNNATTAKEKATFGNLHCRLHFPFSLFSQLTYFYGFYLGICRFTQDVSAFSPSRQHEKYIYHLYATPKKRPNGVERQWDSFSV